MLFADHKHEGRVCELKQTFSKELMAVKADHEERLAKATSAFKAEAETTFAQQKEVAKLWQENDGYRQAGKRQQEKYEKLQSENQTIVGEKEDLEEKLVDQDAMCHELAGSAENWGTKFKGSLRQAVQDEARRREDTHEGFGVDRDEPTPLDQKKTETDDMLRLVSTRWVQIHKEYVDEGSEAYGVYQKDAIEREFNARPDAEKINPEDDMSDDVTESDQMVVKISFRNKLVACPGYTRGFSGRHLHSVIEFSGVSYAPGSPAAERSDHLPLHSSPFISTSLASKTTPVLLACVKRKPFHTARGNYIRYTHRVPFHLPSYSVTDEE
ncbi:hypothetical protein PITC_083630 [Penicillium italicum]|uniref:Uncharacterized protein n=1 Tax=Penicillium italicum TaxID=40296 RepID=A0A0A2L457_PENIT|nr:hypothetical protein PITC_083630 [Penicillium italicum]